MSTASVETRPLGGRALDEELQRIAKWWLERGPDAAHGGFVGEIDADGRPQPQRNRGIVLLSRILWFFSTLARRQGDPACHDAARRAYGSLCEHFHDADDGGVYWEVAADGRPVSDRKQSYGLAFAIYACVAWHRACGEAEPLQRALSYFDCLERHVRDRRHGGYLEALSRQWLTLYDLRLGEGDMNAPKSTNTHLHLLEAYTELHRAAPSPTTAEALDHLLGLFCDRIALSPRGPLGSFFDSRWNRLGKVQSFGHEIEAAWLLWEAAETLRNPQRTARVRPLSIGLAESCLLQGIGDDGRLCESRDPETGQRQEASVWWVQAEALVGFLTAWRLSGENRYREAAEAVWRHVQARHIDPTGNEWFWWPPDELRESALPYKAGFWKGPYHNGRAMMVAADRLAEAGTG